MSLMNDAQLAIYRPTVSGNDQTYARLQQAKGLNVGILASLRDAAVNAALQCRGAIWAAADSFATEMSASYPASLAARSDAAALRLRDDYRKTVLDNLQANTDETVAANLVDAINALKSGIDREAARATLPSALSGKFDLQKASQRVETTRAFEARGAQAALEAHVQMSDPANVGQPGEGYTLDELTLLEDAVELLAKSIAAQGNAALPKVNAPGESYTLRAGDLSDETSAARQLVARIAAARAARVPQFVTDARVALYHLETACGVLVGQSVVHLDSHAFGRILASGGIPDNLAVQPDWMVRFLRDSGPELQGWTPLKNVKGGQVRTAPKK